MTQGSPTVGQTFNQYPPPLPMKDEAKQIFHFLFFHCLLLMVKLKIAFIDHRYKLDTGSTIRITWRICEHTESWAYCRVSDSLELTISQVLLMLLN